MYHVIYTAKEFLSKTVLLQVSIKLFKNGNRCAFFVFNGSNSNSDNWMSKDRLISTSYGDTKNENLEYTQLR